MLFSSQKHTWSVICQGIAALIALSAIGVAQEPPAGPGRGRQRGRPQDTEVWEPVPKVVTPGSGKIVPDRRSLSACGSAPFLLVSLPAHRLADASANTMGGASPMQSRPGKPHPARSGAKIAGLPTAPYSAPPSVRGHNAPLLGADQPESPACRPRAGWSVPTWPRRETAVGEKCITTCTRRIKNWQSVIDHPRSWEPKRKSLITGACH